MVVTDQPLSVVPGGQAELLGEGLVVLVVVAALAGGVLDAAGVGQGVGGLVQQRAEDLFRVRRSPSPLMMTSAYCCPLTFHRPGAWVAPAGVLAVGAAGDDDDGRGDVRVPAADFQPGLFEDLQDRAGGLEALRLPSLEPFPVRVPLPGLV